MTDNRALLLLKRRFLLAGKYSVEGLVASFRREEAFRCEVILALLFFPLSFWLGRTLQEALLLVMTIFGVLIAELLNTAMEAAIDRSGTEIDDLAKYAKDAGSAAVFLSMMLFLLVWGAVIWQQF